MTMLNKIILLALVCMTITALCGCAPSEAPEREISFHVAGMYCDGCVGAVQNRMERFEGITDVQVSLSDSLVTIKGPENRIPTAEQISEAISSLGYEALLQPENMP